MSDTNTEDMKTPRPQCAGQEIAFFSTAPVEDSNYGIRSYATSAKSSNYADKANMQSLDAIMAQQELAARALSEDRSCPSPSSEAGQKRLHNVDKVATPSPGLSEQYSSRPQTPISQPSLPPVSSNPSNFLEDQVSAFAVPSLVMPEITVNLRRAYTDAGRRVGKLRVMFCGDSSSGKTTLMQTFADQCADIVYHEDMVGSEPGRPTTEINEVRASSQPSPAWKTNSAASLSDSIMERNICLIDTPGYGLSAEADDAIDPILQYLETQFRKTNQILRDNIQLANDDFLSLIAAPQGGFTHVDIIIYCIVRELTEVDLSFIDKLSQYTSVFPVITRADSRTSDECHALQNKVTSQLSDLSLQISLRDTPVAAQPFIISCSDPEIECSIMMHDDYQPTLVPSDLHHLFAAILHNDHPAQLRHMTAQKFLAWKAKYQSLVTLADFETSLLPSAEFTVSRIAEHTAQEDRKSRTRIAAWANEMRTSFALSHASNVDIASNEKSAEWLISRMNDYIRQEKQVAALNGESTRGTFIDESDPFGLLRLRNRWSRGLRKVSKWCLDLGVIAGVAFVCYQLWQTLTEC